MAKLLGFLRSLLYNYLALCVVCLQLNYIIKRVDTQCLAAKSIHFFYFWLLLIATAPFQTIPNAISTKRATTTTKAEIINPCIIGLMPDFFISLNEVLSPIAASAQTIKNLLTDLVAETTSVGIENILAIIAIAKNPKMNHGKILVKLKLVLISFSSFPAFMASFLFKFIWIKAKVKTVGMIESVRVSLTIVAKSPAASEKAYPVATTEDVSLTAVPAQIPKASALIPIARPMMGNNTIIAISKRKVADMAYATSVSSASIVGAMAAIAEPPHIPVPAEIRLESFQLSPNALPIKYPPPKQVASVNIITTRDIFPTCKIVFILSDSPRSIIANLSIFFDVNLTPGAIKLFLPIK